MPLNRVRNANDSDMVRITRWNEAFFKIFQQKISLKGPYFLGVCLLIGGV
ncbi:hypothetical protein HBN54_004422 [Hymenobacter sp. 1B]|uniref:ABC transporter permease n=1 Tax=Hymenobacter artigasi TaxID=2719616 RepID=A0ABX1HNR5_9BACT|nr:hypothetical protein [Hymenobacter artigasi]